MLMQADRSFERTAGADRIGCRTRKEDPMDAGKIFEKKPGIGLNPYLPEYEYIPDGEPHVFGDRIYVYGSHDHFEGKVFCMGDYVSYSASVKDLTKWRFEGVIYTRTQDPRMADGTHFLWAPDVVQGKDGRYYLYYCPDDTIKSIGVAVCDTPAGKYEFLGVVQDRNGGRLGERPGDTIAFDPGVYIDEDGEIYLYSGNGPRTKSAIGKEPKASVVVKLCDDMITMKSEPVHLLPALGESLETGFEGHEFFEASSIRKINGLYYLVYSSAALHQLCYAVSKRPDGDYRYGGVLISNAELFESDAKPAMKNCWGNNHGSIEIIDGQYYIFYHVPTNRSMYSRQGRAEKLTILPDGTIPQVHMTSQGLNGAPLPAEGTWPASCVCILHGKKPPAIAHALAMGKRHPYVTQDGPDFPVESMPEGAPAPRQYITNGKDGMLAGFRYFDAAEPVGLSVTARGKMKGLLEVRTGRDGTLRGTIPVSSAKEWTEFRGDVRIPAGVQGIYLVYRGRGAIDLLEFSFISE